MGSLYHPRRFADSAATGTIAPGRMGAQPYPVHLTPHPHLTPASMPLPIPLAVHGALPPTAPFIPLQPPSYIPLHHPTTTASTTTLPPPRLLPTAAVQTALPQPLFDGERVAAAAAQAQAAQAAVRATAAAQAVAALLLASAASGCSRALPLAPWRVLHSRRALWQCSRFRSSPQPPYHHSRRNKQRQSRRLYHQPSSLATA